MSRPFWYGSVLAPVIAGVLMTVLASAAIFLIPKYGESSLTILMVVGFVLVGLSMVWYAVANVMAFYHVLTDPNNEQKIFWVLGWLLANLVMHLAFIWLYVMKQEPEDAPG